MLLITHNWAVHKLRTCKHTHIHKDQHVLWHVRAQTHACCEFLMRKFLMCVSVHSRVLAGLGGLPAQRKP